MIKSVKSIIAMMLVLIFLTGCSSTPNSSSANKTDTAVEKTSIDSLDGVSDEDLRRQVIDYIESNPNEIETITNYALITRDFHKNMKIKQQKGKDLEVVINAVPLLGGMAIDANAEGFLKSYKKALVKKIGDNTPLIKVTDKLLKHNDPMLKETHDIFLKSHLKENIEATTYDTLVKISALMYREMEPIVDDAKTRWSIDPDVFDFIDVAVYETFYKEENRLKKESAQKALSSIYEKLAITDNLTAVRYWEAKIPRWQYPYRISNQAIPDTDSLVYDDCASEAMRQELYSLLNGTWESIITGKKEVIQFNPKSDHRLTEDNKIGYIDVMSKDAPYAVFNIPNGNKRIFITQISYTYPFGGKSEEVLVMYKDHKFLSFNDYSQGEGYSENLRIENISNAKDILIKRKNENGNFEGTFDSRTAFNVSEKKYYMSDKLAPAYFPDFDNDFIYEMMEPYVSNKDSWDRMVEMLNGNWHSLVGKNDLNISVSYSNKNKSCKYYLNYISFIGKDIDYSRCTISDYNMKSNPKSIAIIPAIDRDTGEEISVMYINYKLLRYNGEDKGGKYVENITIDNIKSADNVLIKQ